MSEPRYLQGFGNELASEARSGALPVGRNSPQRPPFGLYAEKLSGNAFTAPRAANARSWLYRIRPSVVHGDFTGIDAGLWHSGASPDLALPPNPLRWGPLPVPDAATDFIDGMTTIAINGDPLMQAGIGVHIYRANRSMDDRFFHNADGELLVVPEQGELRVHTEFGLLELPPGHVGLLPRGMRFRVELAAASARGYVCENYGARFELPELGPIGTDGLANRRDFDVPVAAFEDREGDFELVAKLGGRLHACRIGHSPLDVVAWHGNLAPCRYDLARFNAIGSISYDHPDPSIFTVLTSMSDTPGTANVDFVVFPPRWLVAEDTFRPPWFHRNVMSEYMGLVHGAYDAKAEGFLPGGASLHNCMAAHGPDAATHAAASRATLEPEKLDDTLAFMFETRYPLMPSRYAMDSPERDHAYTECWQGLGRHYDA